MLTVPEKIAPHLPYLRRYARALSGSQRSGDAYVVATMGAIFEDPSCLADGADDRVGLYRAFAKLWSSINSGAGEKFSTGQGGVATVEEKLRVLAPQSRQAFLLEFLDDFSPSEIAAILNIGLQEVDRLIAKADAELRELITTDVLIIEDEAAIAEDLEQLVKSLGHEVVGVARTHREALALARRSKPGLLLVDIVLADGSSGIDAANDILADRKIPIIFITANPEMLLTGERPEPTFLITKPYKETAVKATISQALFFEQKASAGRPDSSIALGQGAGLP